MMCTLSRIRTCLVRFKNSERGSISIELVAMVPLLVVITLGLITFFDAFKARTTAARTSVVMSDLISRETNEVTPQFLDGVNGVMQSMIKSDDAPEYRLTAFTWSDTQDAFQVRWSKFRGNRIPHNDVSLNRIEQQLPQLRNGQRAMLLETWVDYEPLTKFGLEQGTTFENRLVAAQRFVPQLCYMENPDDNAITAEC